MGFCAVFFLSVFIINRSYSDLESGNFIVNNLKKEFIDSIPPSLHHLEKQTLCFCVHKAIHL